MTTQGINVDILDGNAMSADYRDPSGDEPACCLDGCSWQHCSVSCLNACVWNNCRTGGGIALQRFPIFGQARSGERQKLAVKGADGNQRRDKETAVRDDEPEIAFALFGVPSNPEVTRRQLSKGWLENSWSARNCPGGL
jgi:hypothetical protein